METGAATGLMRASTGTVPTPDCKKTSRSTVTIAGVPVDWLADMLKLKKTCGFNDGIEYRPVESEVSCPPPPTNWTVTPVSGKPVTSDSTVPARTPEETT